MKTNVYICRERRYGADGYNFVHEYYANAFDTYYETGWIRKEQLNIIFPNEKYNIIRRD